MTIKVKYENGVLRPLEKIKLKDKEIYEIEVNPKRKIEVKLIPPEVLEKLCGIISIGGDAVKDSEDIYDE